MCVCDSTHLTTHIAMASPPLSSTLAHLVEESGCSLEHPKAAVFRGHILSGQWQEVREGGRGGYERGVRKGDRDRLARRVCWGMCGM